MVELIYMELFLYTRFTYLERKKSPTTKSKNLIKLEHALHIYRYRVFILLVFVSFTMEKCKYIMTVGFIPLKQLKFFVVPHIYFFALSTNWFTSLGVVPNTGIYYFRFFCAKSVSSGGSKLLNLNTLCIDIICGVPIVLSWEIKTDLFSTFTMEFLFKVDLLIG